MFIAESFSDYWSDLSLVEAPLLYVTAGDLSSQSAVGACLMVRRIVSATFMRMEQGTQGLSACWCAVWRRRSTIHKRMCQVRAGAVELGWVEIYCRRSPELHWQDRQAIEAQFRRKDRTA